MMVPLSEAVARSVPELFSASAEIGALCVRMISDTVRDLVEKSGLTGSLSKTLLLRLFLSNWERRRRVPQ